MKEVIYRDGIREDESLHELTRQGTDRLETTLGHSASLVTAEWDRGEDADGHVLVLLKLSDFTGAVTAVFEPEELASTSQLRSRLHRIWGDLLQVRSHRQLQELIGRSGTVMIFQVELSKTRSRISRDLPPNFRCPFSVPTFSR